MTKFKVGDKICCINDDNGTYKYLIKGKEYTVLDTRFEHGVYFVVVEDEVAQSINIDEIAGHFERRFELVTEAQETQMNTVTYRLIGNSNLIVVFNNGEPQSIDSSNSNFDKTLSVLRKIGSDPERRNSNGYSITSQEKEYIEDMMSDHRRVTNFLGDSDIKINGYSIEYNGEVLTGYLVDTILRMMEEGVDDVTPLVNFLKNLQENPSYRVREQLYKFLEYGKNAITPDGCFLTYKYVNDNYESCHSGVWRDNKFFPQERYDHSIGKRVEMPREKVDDDPNRTCSSGLHVCSREYVEFAVNGGYRIMVCKVNPRDVVSVPTDYNNTKMRTCGYNVVGELTSEQVRDDVLTQKSVEDSWNVTETFEVTDNDGPIFSVHYDYRFSELTVRFGCSDYVYFSVDPDTAEEFLSGRPLIDTFNQFIRNGEYLYERIG